ncbi:MAG: thioredoxin family protein [Bacteroidaceae bacterium]|nr:thioredoxin family protein [Bacteroidaceae bacterium]
MKKTTPCAHALLVILFLLTTLTMRAQKSDNNQSFQGIIDTYWLNPSTGDWFLGITSRHIIYNNKVIPILSMREKNDTYDLVLADRLPVKIGKLKDGRRPITIGYDNPVKYDQITTPTLPDYPIRDIRSGFVDTRCQSVDTITIMGWFKDMSTEDWEKGREVSVVYDNFFTCKREKTSAPMDSLGRFTLRLPILNTMEVFIDGNRSNIFSVMEPGNTYFLLHDFKTGQILWMGQDCRLQNELLSLPLSTARNDFKSLSKHQNLMSFWASTDSVYHEQMKHYRATLQEHPKVSRRFKEYCEDYYRMYQARDMAQAPFYTQSNVAPHEYLDYITSTFWHSVPKPFTLHHVASMFLTDYVDIMLYSKRVVYNGKQYVFSTLEDTPYILRKLKERGEIQITDEELALFERKAREERILLSKYDGEEFKEAHSKFMESDLAKKCREILKYKDHSKADWLSNYYRVLSSCESVGCDEYLRDFVLTRLAYNDINKLRHSFVLGEMSFLMDYVKLPTARSYIRSLNDKYLAIEQSDFDNSVSFKSAVKLENISEGEKLLREIISPYKGKIVLLDIWGTWCRPCVDALSQSYKEFERLKDYDIVYLYLCSRSKEDDWKDVIRSYNLVGDNIVHYRLSTDQQDAIENYLHVSSFPSYHLFDRNGKHLDVNADPRQLESLATFLSNLK